MRSTKRPPATTTFRRRTPSAPSSCSCTDCLIAEDDNGTPCGYCLLALTWSNEAGGLCVWLEEIMVDDEKRGKGVGSRMIAAVHEKYNAAARYRLEVTDDNPRAAALYRLLGFEELPYRQMIIDTPPLD